MFLNRPVGGRVVPEALVLIHLQQTQHHAQTTRRNPAISTHFCQRGAELDILLGHQVQLLVRQAEVEASRELLQFGHVLASNIDIKPVVACYFFMNVRRNDSF